MLYNPQTQEVLYSYFEVLSIVEQVFKRQPKDLDDAERIANEIIERMTDQLFDQE